MAFLQHRRLDAVYYYMRSLATVPPFQSAYDSLVAIFAETGQKVSVPGVDVPPEGVGLQWLPPVNSLCLCLSHINKDGTFLNSNKKLK